MRIASITKKEAQAYFKAHSAFRGGFDVAISARDERGIHGVIALTLIGEECRKAQISTDGNAHVGSLLYGAAVRAAMALGYRSLTF